MNARGVLRFLADEALGVYVQFSAVLLFAGLVVFSCVAPPYAPAGVTCSGAGCINYPTIKGGVLTEQAVATTTVPTTGGATIASIPSLTVTAGQRVFLTWTISGDPSTSTATVVTADQTSGSATAVWYVSGGTASTTAITVWATGVYAASGALGDSGSAYLLVTGSGTMVLDLVATSTTANWATASVRAVAYVEDGP